jgi:hypothetical protein
LARSEEGDRERRIVYEIVVDAYTQDERVVGWHAYLEERLDFPFSARVVGGSGEIFPLVAGDEVEAIQMAEIEECESGMKVEVEWLEDDLTVPLERLYPVEPDPRRREAIEDWVYWVERGYGF